MTVGRFGSWRHLRRLMPCWVILTALVLPSSHDALADPVLPPKTGSVVDAADILRPNQEQSLTAQLDQVKQRSKVELMVVTLPSLQQISIEQWGRALGEGWGVGGKNGLGALLIVAPNDRQVRIEVGDALSGMITDREASTIIESRIIPQFRSGEMSGGVLAGIDAMIQEAMPSTAPASNPVSSPVTWTTQKHSLQQTRLSETALHIGLVVVIVLVLLLLWRHPEILIWLGNHTGAGADDDWVSRRRYRKYSTDDNSSYSFGSSGSSHSSWSGSGSSGSWGSSRGSSSSSSSGGFSGRGASGRW